MKTFPIFFVLLVCACVPASYEAKQEHLQADVHYKLAMAHLQADNPTMALKELLVAVKQNPQNSSIQVALAQTYQRKKAYPQSETHYLKALELANNEPRYQNNLASLYLDMEEWNKAIDYFDRASKNLLFANAHVAVAGKAYAYFKKRDYPAALRFSTEATEIAPRYVSAYFLKSEIYQALGDVDQEMLFLQRCVEIAPQYLYARYRLAVLLLQEDAHTDAIAQLKTIIEFSPTSELGNKARSLLKTIPES